MTIIEINGLHFRVSTADDPDHGAPWEESAGWGVIDHEPSGDHLGGGWFYHRTESIARATDEEWNVPEPVLFRMTRTLQRPPTRSEIIAAAVNIDRAAAVAYLAGDWHYVSVQVELLNIDGDATGLTATTHGVESNDPDYQAQVATDLAEELAARYPTARSFSRGAVTHQIRATPTTPPKPVQSPIYHPIKAALLATGMPRKKAGIVARHFARLGVPDEEILALFRKEHPSAPTITDLA